MDYGYEIINGIPTYVVSIDGQLTVTGDIIGGTSSGGGTIHANTISPIPPSTAVTIDNIICTTIDVDDNLLQASDLHSKHALDTSNSVVARGQFICVHDVDPLEAMGFCFGPDEDEVTGNFNFMVDDAAGSILLASNIAGVLTPMWQADKATGETTFPGGIVTDSISEATAAGIQLGIQMLVDDTNTRVDINNTLRCDLIDSITGINGVVIDNTLAVNNSTNVVDIAVGSSLRADDINSLSGAGIDSADSIIIANTKSLSTNTINSTSALGIEVIDTLAVGTSTQPANVSDSVIQIKSKSDATYGNPVSSALLYVDSDDALKCKNVGGAIVNLSSLPSYASFYRLGNGTDTVITTADVFTRTETVIGTNVASGFSIATSTITYTGTPSVNARFVMSGSILTANNLLLVGMACARNGTFNGSGELTSSIINGSAAETSVNVAGQQGALSSCFTSPCVNGDTFTILVKNATSADDINLRIINITIETFSAGTD